MDVNQTLFEKMGFPKGELPKTWYRFDLEDLWDILDESGLSYTKFPVPFSLQVCQKSKETISLIEKFIEERSYTKDELAMLLTALRPYEDQSIPEKLIKLNPDDDALVKVPYKQKVVYALFFLYKEDKYEYKRIRITKSTIKGAGLGAFAVDPLPEDAIAQYIGVSVRSRNSNPAYSWSVRQYNLHSGEQENDKDLWYIDASDHSRSNWTRFANCGVTNKHNNLEVEQVYDKIYYRTIRPIQPGEELFIDYGEEYRTENLGLKGTY